MDIQEQLDTIEQRRQDFLNQTNAEKNTQLIKESYDEYVSAKEINEYAPEQLAQAETNYYKARYGIDYLDKQKEKYKSESIQMTDEKIKAHQAQLEKLNETLDNYKNSEKYSKSINEVKAMHLAKIKELIKKIRLSDANTNQQKTFYTEQEEDTINSYIITLNWMIGLFTVYFIFEHRRNPKSIIAPVIFLITILFLLKPLVHLVETLYKVQLNIGYDPMKSKWPWFLYGFLILIAIWMWVYLDMLTMMLQSTFTPAPPGPAPAAPAAPPFLATIGTSLHVAVNNIIGFFIRMYLNMAALTSGVTTAGIFNSISAFFIRMYVNMTWLFNGLSTIFASMGVGMVNFLNNTSAFFRRIYINMAGLSSTVSTMVASKITRPSPSAPPIDDVEMLPRNV
jgi:hypothetical protein